MLNDSYKTASVIADMETKRVNEKEDGFARELFGRSWDECDEWEREEVTYKMMDWYDEEDESCW